MEKTLNSAVLNKLLAEGKKHVMEPDIGYIKRCIQRLWKHPAEHEMIKDQIYNSLVNGRTGAFPLNLGLVVNKYEVIFDGKDFFLKPQGPATGLESPGA